MLVLIGPDFDGTKDAYTRLGRATGLVAYDLKARVRPGAWGVVKVLADASQAEALAKALEQAGFRALLVSRDITHDPERRILHPRGVTLEATSLNLHFSEQDLPVEYAAVACLVRGEVQPGRAAPRGASSASSGAALRAVTQVDSLPREMPVSAFEAYHAVDIHFLTVPWIARVDVRAVGSPHGEPGVRALDALADELARRANVRVDRCVRTSSLASFAEQSISLRDATPDTKAVRDQRREQPDERFDPYSRLVGEAERRLRGALQPEVGQPG